MYRKTVSISEKRQITIPKKFFTQLGFGDEAECLVRNGELVVRPVTASGGGEFSEGILADLIAQGYEGQGLLEEFRRLQRQVRPAVEAVMTEASLAAEGRAEYFTVDEVFGTEK